MAMLFKTKFLFFICCGLGLLTSSILAQENQTIDSLLNVYRTQTADTTRFLTNQRIVTYYLYRDRDRSKQFGLEGLELANKIKDPLHQSLAHYQLGSIYYDLGLNDSTKFHYSKSSDYAKEANDETRIAKGMEGLALLEFSQGNLDEAERIVYEKALLNEQSSDSAGLAWSYEILARINMNRGFNSIALEKILEAGKIYKSLGDEIRMADALGLMANLETFFDNKENAINYHLEALEIYKKHEDVFYQSQQYNDLGLLHANLRKLDKADSLLAIGIEVAQNSGNQYILASLLDNMALVKMYKKKYPESEQLYLEAIKMAEAINAQRKVAITKGRLARMYNEINRPQKAKEILDRLEDYFEETENASLMAKTLEQRSVAYEEMGDTKSALIDYKRAKGIRDSLFDIEKSRQVEEMRAQFDLERKEERLKLQETEIAVLAQRKRIDQQQKWLLALGALVLVALLGFVYFRFKERAKRARLENEKVASQLEFKKKELTSHALHLAKKNEVLLSLKEKVENLDSNGTSSKDILNTINFDLRDEENWADFTKYFEQVHTHFGKEVQKRYPGLTPSEFRLMALLKMNLSSKEIASMLHITSEGVKKARQRLRKKMNLTPDESLEAQVMAI